MSIGWHASSQGGSGFMCCWATFLLALTPVISVADDSDESTRAQRIKAILEQREVRAGDTADSLPATPATPATLSPQQVLDRAPAGSVVNLTPGDYPGGLVIRKPLTVNMRGVVLHGVAWRKAMVVIESPGGPVILNDFRGDGADAGADIGNLAAVRVSGPNFDVTVNRAHIRGTAMGVLTDNRGGVLRIRDSLIEDTGLGTGERSLSHIVYAGLIDRLEISSTTLRRSHHLGHLLKSRARVTRVTGSRLLGDDSYHSRVIDLPCGGDLRIESSNLQRSGQADNRELIALGMEFDTGCPGREETSSLSLRHSTLTLGSPDAKASGATIYLLRWVGNVAGFEVDDNILVTHGLPWRESVPGSQLPALPASNVVKHEPDLQSGSS